MEPLVTHQEYRYFTTYKLEDYTNELCQKHRLYYSKHSFDCEYIQNFFNDVVGEEEKQSYVVNRIGKNIKQNLDNKQSIEHLLLEQ